MHDQPMIEKQEQKSKEEKDIYVGSIVLIVQGILIMMFVIHVCYKAGDPIKIKDKEVFFLPFLSILAGVLGLKIRENATGFHALIITHMLVYTLIAIRFKSLSNPLSNIISFTVVNLGLL